MLAILFYPPLEPVMLNLAEWYMRKLAIVTLLACIGCSSGEPTQSVVELGATLPHDAAIALKSGTDFELYSIDPLDLEPNGFHGFAKLGLARPSQTDRKRIIDAMVKGVAESDGSIAACFEPRHAVRVFHDGKRHDFVICFECLQIHWYTDDVKNPMILTARSPLQVFNDVYAQLSIPLADPPLGL